MTAWAFFLGGMFGLFMTLHGVAGGYIQVHNGKVECGPITHSNDEASK